MIEAVLVTILPVGFLIIIFLGGALFLKKKISQDGEAPINSGVPDSLSCISGGLKWEIPFVSEPRRRTPASGRTGYSG